ncbi:MAG: hypothetical protein RL757_975 [Bacteroidota bacterium]|jgi:diphosphomevalonate decarboxylase
MNLEQPDLLLSVAQLQRAEGHTTWQSPSNIAVIKYWGKHGVQLPRNPSVSFTLRDAVTTTQLGFAPRQSAQTEPISLQFSFEGQPNEAFRAKQVKFLASLLPIFPFLKQLDLTISSRNSFPHSAGIASSASSMSALAMCLCDLESMLFGHDFDEKMLQKASFLARLGSGSACRSLYPTMAIWGETPSVKKSSDLYAVEFEPHPIFKNYHDAILIAGKGEKSVSSRMGHGLMDGNAYAPARYAQANQRMETVLNAFRTGDVETFGQILEDEAMTLHALMMTSSPSFTLLRPNTLAMIEKLRQFRAETKTPVYFTLDAGPNPHVMYPDSVATVVKNFIESELVPLCENGFWIADKVGNGAAKISL